MELKRARAEVLVGPFRFPASCGADGVRLETGTVMTWVFEAFFVWFWNGAVVIHEGCEHADC